MENAKEKKSLICLTGIMFLYNLCLMFFNVFTLIPFKITVILYVFFILLFAYCLKRSSKCTRNNLKKQPQYIDYILVIIGVSTSVGAIFIRSPGIFIVGGVFVLIFLLRRYLMNAMTSLAFTSYSYAMVIFFDVLLILMYILAPLNKYQYGGIFVDANNLASITILSFLSCLYLYEVRRETGENFKVGIKLYLISNIAFSISILLFTRSRTALFCGLVILLFYNVYLILHKKWKLSFIINIFVATLVVFFISYSFLTYVTPNTAKALSNNLGKEYHKFYQLRYGEHKKVQINDLIQEFDKKNFKGIDDEDSFTSGRVDIWKEVIKQSSVLGHRDETIYVKAHFKNKMYAHNSFLQVWYSLGIVPGIFYFALMIIFGLYELKMMINIRRWKKEHFFAFSMIGFYLVYICLFSVYNPLMTYNALGFYIVIILLNKDFLEFKRGKKLNE